jgi:hypothetical protein
MPTYTAVTRYFQAWRVKYFWVLYFKVPRSYMVKINNFDFLRFMSAYVLHIVIRRQACVKPFKIMIFFSRNVDMLKDTKFVLIFCRAVFD